MLDLLSRRSFAQMAGCAMAALVAGGTVTALAAEGGQGQGQGGQGQSGQGDQGGQGQSGQGGGMGASVGAEPQELRYDEDGNRIVVDSGGTEVVCPKEITSIMTFGSLGPINTMIETLGCGHLIANEMSPRFQGHVWQYRFAPQMADCPQFEDQSGEIDIENLVAANPDLCVVMQPATAQTLRDNGLNTLLLGFGDGRGPESIQNAVTILGQALGAMDKAEEYNAYVDDMVKKIDEVTAGIPEDEKLKVLYGNVPSFTNPHILSEWFIPAAGGISVTADIHTDASCTYTAEDLLTWDPDVIIMISDTSEELKADEQINSVKAIQNDRMFTCPTIGHFITGSSEIPIGILWVANKLYPDIYPEEELAEDIRYFYSTFMNYDMNDEEIDSIVNYEG